jgi:hypothetical protein
VASDVPPRAVFVALLLGNADVTFSFFIEHLLESWILSERGLRIKRVGPKLIDQKNSWCSKRVTR